MIAAKENLKEVITQYDEFKNREDKIQRLKYMRNLIKVYHNFEKNYEEIMNKYKIRYIHNESKVEGNITPE